MTVCHTFDHIYIIARAQNKLNTTTTYNAKASTVQHAVMSLFYCCVWKTHTIATSETTKAMTLILKR